MSTDNIEKVRYGSRIINCSIIQSNRKTLGITVTPDKQVIIRCPYNVSRDKVSKLIHKRLSWISNKLSYFDSLPYKIPPRKYVSGETHYYLGKQYRLKIIKSRLEDVKLKGSYLFVYTLKGDNKRIVQLLLDNWYKERAKKNFHNKFAKWLPYFKKYNIQLPRMVIKKMKKRWGSCNTIDRITLNQELIKTPISCIDYVIVHELCHMIHRNHDKGYNKLLGNIFPNWKHYKLILDKYWVNY